MARPFPISLCRPFDCADCGPIGLPLALDRPSRVARVILLNTWAWPLDDDPKMAKGAREIGGAIGRLLYRYANASLRLIMPSAYGDRKKLTAPIHAHYLNVFRDRDARGLVLPARGRTRRGDRGHRRLPEIRLKRS